MEAKLRTTVLVGLRAAIVEITARTTRHGGQITIVGLPEPSAREHRIRVQAALASLELLPEKDIVLSLEPSEPECTAKPLDLALIIAVLVASGQIPAGAVARTLLVGDVNLSARLRFTHGILAHLADARDLGFSGAIIPAANAEEASLVKDGLETRIADDVMEVVAFLQGREDLRHATGNASPMADRPYDLRDIAGHSKAKRALEIAAAGQHNLLLVGPPGAGASSLARHTTTLLPPLSPSSLFELTRVHSVAGLLQLQEGRLPNRPFRAPHHTVSTGGLLGTGGNGRVGEITLAHHGVLFLDQLTEFTKANLEALATVMGRRSVSIAWKVQNVSLPAGPIVIASMSLCPCGYADVPDKCRCPPSSVAWYRSRLPQTLRRKFDLEVRLPLPQPQDEFDKPRERSDDVRARVVTARHRQSARFEGEPNSQLAWARLKEAVGAPADELPVNVLRLARTIADLADADRVSSQHIEEALELDQ